MAKKKASHAQLMARKKFVEFVKLKSKIGLAKAKAKVYGKK